MPSTRESETMRTFFVLAVLSILGIAPANSAVVTDQESDTSSKCQISFVGFVDFNLEGQEVFPNDHQACRFNDEEEAQDSDQVRTSGEILVGPQPGWSSPQDVNPKLALAPLPADYVLLNEGLR